MRGKIVLVNWPFFDLTGVKLRPALVLNDNTYNVTVAFISSKIPSTLSNTEVIIRMSHREFLQTGLKKKSVIKLDKVATLSKKVVRGELGELGSTLKEEVNSKIKNVKNKIFGDL